MDQNEGRHTMPEEYDDVQQAAYLEGMKEARAQAHRRSSAEAPSDLATSALSGAGLAILIVSLTHDLPLFGVATALVAGGVAVGNAYRLVRNLQEDRAAKETLREFLMLPAWLSVIAISLAPNALTTAICMVAVGASLINESRNWFQGNRANRQKRDQQDQDQGG